MTQREHAAATGISADRYDALARMHFTQAENAPDYAAFRAEVSRRQEQRAAAAFAAPVRVTPEVDPGPQSDRHHEAGCECGNWPNECMF